MEIAKLIGNALRVVRKNKNETITDFYGKRMSEKYAYRIEGGHQNIGQEKLEKVLRDNGVSFEELIFICRGYQKRALDEIMDQFLKVGSDFIGTNMNQLLSQVKEIKKERKLCAYLETITRAYMPQQTDEAIQKLILPIWVTLAEQEQWTYYELIVMCHVLYMIDITQIDVIASRVFKSLERYKGYQNVERLQIATWFCFCERLRLNGRFCETKDLLECTLKRAIAREDGLMIFKCEFRLCELARIESSEDRTDISAKVDRILSGLLVMQQVDTAFAFKKDWLGAGIEVASL
ncbi:hypothetical protein [Listeria sp. ILCC797]|uniref:hypothetical protein n=1 Tax=Listeria sp. ILCC797 TaxID=1918333 RepID=UPI000B58BAF9|nr:hypothetical protein [Listeria sp. ILCC797]